jgi:hypothetical protein
MLIIPSSTLDSSNFSVAQEGEDIYASDQWAAVLNMVRASMTPSQLRTWDEDTMRQENTWFTNRPAELSGRTYHELENIQTRLRQRAHLVHALTRSTTSRHEATRTRGQIAALDMRDSSRSAQVPRSSWCGFNSAPQLRRFAGVQLH